jgi:archaellum component FlaC
MTASLRIAFLQIDSPSLLCAAVKHRSLQWSMYFVQVSDLKSDVDQQKGTKLDAISQIVTEINNKIQDRKDTLGPKVKALRQARANLEELQCKHSEARATYMRVQDVQQSKLGSLGERVAALQTASAEV